MRVYVYSFFGFLFQIECPALLNGRCAPNLRVGVISTGTACNDMKERPFHVYGEYTHTCWKGKQRWACSLFPVQVAAVYAMRY